MKVVRQQPFQQSSYATNLYCRTTLGGLPESYSYQKPTSLLHPQLSQQTERDLSWPCGSLLGITRLATIRHGILAASFA